MKVKEQKAMNYVQSLFYTDVNELVENFKLPQQKFIHKMIYGIIKSKSVIGQQVAVALNENITLKKSCDKIYRNLKRQFLNDELMISHMCKCSSEITDETPIIVDMSDIYKPCANKMEGLDKVWDGSQHKPNPGYFTLQASFCNSNDPKDMKLLYSELFSLKEEGTSENEKILDFIHQSAILNGNKGIYIGDRGFDRGNLLTDMIENENSFIIRGDKRNLLYEGKSLSYREIAKKIDLCYKVMSKNRSFKANIVEVSLKLPNPPERKHQRKKIANLYLVVAKEKGKGFVYYLCHFRKEYSYDKMIKMAIQYYGMRWGIEEIHQQIKTSFGWEKIQLLTYTSLKNMNALLWIAASFIYNKVSKLTIYLIKNLSNKMIYRNLAKEMNINLVYRLTHIVSDFFRGFLVRPRKKHKGKYKKYYLENQQYRLVLNEN